MKNIKTILGILLLWLLFVGSVLLMETYGYNRTMKDKAYDVLASQMAVTHYLMDVERRGGEADQETLEILEGRVADACVELIGRDDAVWCRLAVCYAVGAPLSSCLE